jgi:hypothetical protein
MVDASAQTVSNIAMLLIAGASDDSLELDNQLKNLCIPGHRLPTIWETRANLSVCRSSALNDRDSATFCRPMGLVRPSNYPI